MRKDVIFVRYDHKDLFGVDVSVRSITSNIPNMRTELGYADSVCKFMKCRSSHDWLRPSPERKAEPIQMQLKKW